MKGKVVSYIADKKYGFITGDDGESYFLHVSSLLNKSCELKLVKGGLVDFEPTPTPKGNAAKKVRIIDTYQKKKLVDFFISKQPSPKYGILEQHHSLCTPYYKDPNEAREHLKLLAMTVGCNAILNFDTKRETFEDGNYKYTMHAALGTFALVSEYVTCSSEKEVEESEEYIREQITQFDDNFKIVNQKETGIRFNQVGLDPTHYLFFLGGIAVVIMIFYALLGS